MVSCRPEKSSNTISEAKVAIIVAAFLMFLLYGWAVIAAYIKPKTEVN